MIASKKVGDIVLTYGLERPVHGSTLFVIFCMFVHFKVGLILCQCILDKLVTMVAMFGQKGCVCVDCVLLTDLVLIKEPYCNLVLNFGMNVSSVKGADLKVPKRIELWLMIWLVAIVLHFTVFSSKLGFCRMYVVECSWTVFDASIVSGTSKIGKVPKFRS